MNKMEEERKIRHCPDCGREMEPGILDPYRYVTFRRGKESGSILERLFAEPDTVSLQEDTMFSSEARYYGWICTECRLILFDYSNSRAGMGKSLFDRAADGIEAAFDALDKHFGGWTTEEENQKKWDSPAETAEDSTQETQAEPEKPAPEEKPKKRIITSSGVREVDE